MPPFSEERVEKMAVPKREEETMKVFPAPTSPSSPTLGSARKRARRPGGGDLCPGSGFVRDVTRLSRKCHLERNPDEAEEVHRRFREYVVRADRFTEEQFRNNFDSLPIESQQTGILTHFSLDELPYQRKKKRTTTEVLEEQMSDLLLSLQNSGHNLAPLPLAGVLKPTLLDMPEIVRPKRPGEAGDTSMESIKPIKTKKKKRVRKVLPKPKTPPTVVEDDDAIILNCGEEDDDLLQEVKVEEEKEKEEKTVRKTSAKATTKKNSTVEKMEVDEESEQEKTKMNDLSVELQQSCSTLLRQRICLQLIEFGNCSKEGCKFVHPERVSIENIVLFFTIIRDTQPKRLQHCMRNRETSGVQRLFGIYNANKAPPGMTLNNLDVADVKNFFTLVRLAIDSVINKELDDELTEFLTKIIEDLKLCLSDGKRYPDLFTDLVFVADLFIGKLEKISGCEISSKSQFALVDQLHSITIFACENGLALTGCRYKFLIDMLLPANCPQWALELLVFLNFLPGYPIDIADVDFVMKRYASRLTFTELATYMLPLLKSLDEQSIKQIPIRQFQQLVNRCHNFYTNSEQEQKLLYPYLLYFSELDLGLDLKLQDVSALPPPLLDIDFKSRVDNLINKEQWQQLPPFYFENFVLRDTYRCHRLMSAIFEALVKAESVRILINRFREAITAVTRGYSQSPIEIMFHSQLAATIILHLDMVAPNDAESTYEVLKFASFNFREYFPWKYGPLFKADGKVEAIRVKVPRSRIACIAIKKYLAMKLGWRALQVFRETGVYEITSETTRVEQFLLARQILEVLVCREDPEVPSSEILQDSVISLYRNFLQLLANDVDDNGITFVEKEEIKKTVFNKVLHLALESPIIINDFFVTSPLIIAIPFILENKSASVFDYISIRGLTDRSRKIGKKYPAYNQLAAEFYDLGIIYKTYCKQDLSKKRLVVYQDLTPFEMEALVENFLVEVIRSATSETIENLASKVNSGYSPCELDAEGLDDLRFKLDIRARPRVSGKSDATGLRFIDHLATSTMREGRARIEKVLNTLTPKVYLVGEKEIDVFALVRHLEQKISLQ